MKKIVCIILIVSAFTQCKPQQISTAQKAGNLKEKKISNAIFIDSVWAANKVSFDLHTIDTKQYVAYYDSNRMMTVASRDVSSKVIEKKTLSSQLVWDSHNYVTLGLDEEGYIHVSGNMHNVPLVYYRSEKPYDIQSIVEIHKMTGIDEKGVTYPVFFNDKKGRLYYTYRSGGSGSGNNWVNLYNAKTKTWSRLLEKGLFKGKNGNETRSSYFKFVQGSDGNFHCIWMWRWTPNVETCHQLSYATSPDFVNWTSASGEKIDLPIKPDNEKLIIDNVPTKGGLHNGRHQIAFINKTPIIGYVKYDDYGKTQLYVARFKNDNWVIKQLSSWGFRWKFNGGGDGMTSGGSFDFIPNNNDNFLVINWKTETGEKGFYTIDGNLKILTSGKEMVAKYPKKIRTKLSKNPKMHVNLQDGITHNTNNNLLYVLKWESFVKSHKKSAPKEIPKGPLSALLLIEIE